MAIHQVPVRSLLLSCACSGILLRAQVMKRRAGHWGRLSAEERRLWLGALVLLGRMRVSLWLVAFEPLLQSIRDVPLGRTADSPFSVGQVAWAVRSASRLIPKATCLTQALAGQKLLRGYGYAVELCIGVAKDEVKGFQAHAWLEHEGEIILGRLPDHARYAPLLRRD